MTYEPPAIYRTITPLRRELDELRASGKRVGVVLTMGALHAGHASLIDAAKVECDVVVLTIFVNPTQFGANEDLGAYPRTLDADCELAAAHGATMVFVPEVAEMYPNGTRAQLATVRVADLTSHLCGASRPGHFDGVATVVTKFFGILGPSSAYFGKKDAQQLAVIRKLVADLNIDVEVVGCPIIRESDGLAMSSRNRYLNVEERSAAAEIAAALMRAADEIEAGESAARTIIERVQASLEAIAPGAIDYVEVVDQSQFQPLTEIDRNAVLAVAVKVGKARLIDNLHIDLIDGALLVDRGQRLKAEAP